MTDVTFGIARILRAYVGDPSLPIESLSTLRDLDIDHLDLPMISLDIEDAFGVQIQYDDEIEDTATVQSLAAAVLAHLDAKAKRPLARPRPKSTWLSTSAERRR